MSFLFDFILNVNLSCSAGRRKESKSEFRYAFIGGYVAGLWGVNAYLDTTHGEFVGRYASLSGLAFLRPWSFVFRHFPFQQLSRLLWM